MDARVLLSTTVTEVLDGVVLYTACPQCYAKLAADDCCIRCGFLHGPAVSRYRLCLSVCDSSAVAYVTAFGGMLNPLFGLSADEFNQQYVAPLRAKVGSLTPSVVRTALEHALVGQDMVVGLKGPVKKTQAKNCKPAANLQEAIDLAGLGPQQRTNFVAVQMQTQNKVAETQNVSYFLGLLCSQLENQDLCQAMRESAGDEARLAGMLRLWLNQEQENRNQMSESFVELSQPFRHLVDSRLSFPVSSCSSAYSGGQQSLGFSCDESNLQNSHLENTKINGVSFNDNSHHRLDTFGFDDIDNSQSPTAVLKINTMCDTKRHPGNTTINALSSSQKKPVFEAPFQQDSSKHVTLNLDNSGSSPMLKKLTENKLDDRSVYYQDKENVNCTSTRPINVLNKNQASNKYEVLYNHDTVDHTWCREKYLSSIENESKCVGKPKSKRRSRLSLRRKLGHSSVKEIESFCFKPQSTANNSSISFHDESSVDVGTQGTQFMEFTPNLCNTFDQIFQKHIAIEKYSGFKDLSDYQSSGQSSDGEISMAEETAQLTCPNIFGSPLTELFYLRSDTLNNILESDTKNQRSKNVRSAHHHANVDLKNRAHSPVSTLSLKKQINQNLPACVSFSDEDDFQSRKQRLQVTCLKENEKSQLSDLNSFLEDMPESENLELFLAACETDDLIDSPRKPKHLIKQQLLPGKLEAEHTFHSDKDCDIQESFQPSETVNGIGKQDESSALMDASCISEKYAQHISMYVTSRRGSKSRKRGNKNKHTNSQADFEETLLSKTDDDSLKVIATTNCDNIIDMNVSHFSFSQPILNLEDQAFLMSKSPTFKANTAQTLSLKCVNPVPKQCSNLKKKEMYEMEQTLEEDPPESEDLLQFLDRFEGCEKVEALGMWNSQDKVISLDENQNPCHSKGNTSSTGQSLFCQKEDLSNCQTDTCLKDCDTVELTGKNSGTDLSETSSVSYTSPSNISNCTHQERSVNSLMTPGKFVDISDTTIEIGVACTHIQENERSPGSSLNDPRFSFIDSDLDELSVSLASIKLLTKLPNVPNGNDSILGKKPFQQEQQNNSTSTSKASDIIRQMLSIKSPQMSLDFSPKSTDGMFNYSDSLIDHINLDIQDGLSSNSSQLSNDNLEEKDDLYKNQSSSASKFNDAESIVSISNQAVQSNSIPKKLIPDESNISTTTFDNSNSLGSRTNLTHTSSVDNIVALTAISNPSSFVNKSYSFVCNNSVDLFCSQSESFLFDKTLDLQTEPPCIGALFSTDLSKTDVNSDIVSRKSSLDKNSPENKKKQMNVKFAPLEEKWHFLNRSHSVLLSPPLSETADVGLKSCLKHVPWLAVNSFTLESSSKFSQLDEGSPKKESTPSLISFTSDLPVVKSSSENVLRNMYSICNLKRVNKEKLSTRRRSSTCFPRYIIATETSSISCSPTSESSVRLSSGDPSLISCSPHSVTSDYSFVGRVEKQRYLTLSELESLNVEKGSICSTNRLSDRSSVSTLSELGSLHFEKGSVFGTNQIPYRSSMSSQDLFNDDEDEDTGQAIEAQVNDNIRIRTPVDTSIETFFSADSSLQNKGSYCSLYSPDLFDSSVCCSQIIVTNTNKKNISTVKMSHDKTTTEPYTTSTRSKFQHNTVISTSSCKASNKTPAYCFLDIKGVAPQRKEINLTTPALRRMSRPKTLFNRYCFKNSFSETVDTQQSEDLFAASPMSVGTIDLFETEQVLNEDCFSPDLFDD